MSGSCRVCESGRLTPYLTVAPATGEGLAPTTTSYGSAPDDIVRCERCGHMQVATFPATATLDEAYAEVSEGAYLEEEAGQRATAAAVLERIERHVRGATICDLGCWVGFLLAEAERRGWEARGVEPSVFAARFARERLGLKVQQGTLEEAALQAGEADAVVLADVIEHLPDPGATLDRIATLLAPRGVLFLALPDAGSRVARALGARWWSVLPTHVHYFTRSSMRCLLERHGYEVEWIGTAPKAFTVRYYAARLTGYSPLAAAVVVRTSVRLGVAERLVRPDFRDRMAVVARRVQR